MEIITIDKECRNTSKVLSLIESELNYYNKINKLKYKIKNKEKLAANN